MEELLMLLWDGLLLSVLRSLLPLPWNRNIRVISLGREVRTFCTVLLVVIEGLTCNYCFSGL